VPRALVLRRALTLALALLPVLAGACSDDPPDGDDPSGTSDTSAVDGTSTTAVGPGGSGEAVLWSPEGNNLWAYGTAPAESDPPQFARQLVNTNNHDDPDGWDINGQVCALPVAPGAPPRILAGEDTGQPDPPAGWAVCCPTA
jgi:hypothetical protein